jgi:hypothetical protein
MMIMAVEPPAASKTLCPLHLNSEKIVDPPQIAVSRKDLRNDKPTNPESMA